MYPQLASPLANRSNVAGITEAETIDPGQHVRTGSNVSQVSEPGFHAEWIPGAPLSRHPQMRASGNDGRADHFILITPTASSDSNITFVTS
jgi:hypothetical protein